MENDLSPLFYALLALILAIKVLGAGCSGGTCG